ncbi:hypothetical protein ACFE04_021443 [Oxalis oulophora]
MSSSFNSCSINGGESKQFVYDNSSLNPKFDPPEGHNSVNDVVSHELRYEILELKNAIDQNVKLNVLVEGISLRLQKYIFDLIGWDFGAVDLTGWDFGVGALRVGALRDGALCASALRVVGGMVFI